MNNFKQIVFDKLGYQLSELQLNQFKTYYEFLIEYNKNVNLTRITDLDEVYIKHFLDSILVINLLDFNKINSLLIWEVELVFPVYHLKYFIRI